MKTKEFKLGKVKKYQIEKLKEGIKSKINDKRQAGKKTYKIWDVVIVVILAVLCDCNEWEEIEDFAKSKKKFLKRFLKLSGGIPCAKTYERVLSIVDSSALNNIFVEFITKIKYSYNKEFKDILSFDGKIDRGSSRESNEIRDKIKPLNVLNVYSDKLQYCIEQEMIEEKTNEIPNIPILIERLDLKGVICTWDALNTQTENVKAVVENGGEYVVALKANQKTCYEDVRDYFDEERLKLLRIGYEGSYLVENEKNQSKVITYEYYQTSQIEWYEDKGKWKKLRSIGLVRKTSIDTKGNESIEIRYYISSIFTNIRVFSEAIRKHWNVENKLHWHLDFTFRCDNNTTMNKKALFNLQLIKKFDLRILNEAKKTYENKSLKRIRKDIARDVETELINIFDIITKASNILSS